MTGFNKLMTGLLAGVATGAAAGVLLAPKRGRVTRRFLTGRVGRLRRKVSRGTEMLGVPETASVNGHSR